MMGFAQHIPTDQAPPVEVDQDTRAPGMSAADLGELLSSFNDVTARLQESHEQLTGEVKRLERELSEANRRLERSRRLAALGEMAAGIAHEIRNPLGGIGLYASMLEEDLASTPEHASIAAKIAEGVRSVDAIVRDVLSFARELRPRVEDLDAEEFLESCRDTTIQGVRAAGIREPDSIQISVDPPLLTIACDKGLVRQAIVNLARNACEAMATTDADHGTTLTLGAMERDECVSIVVADTGPGIEPEVIDRMFNPFFTTRDTGSGLGLAIVHRIADAHGGSVCVKSAPGEGARFELVLPHAAAERTAQARTEYAA